MRRASIKSRDVVMVFYTVFVVCYYKRARTKYTFILFWFYCRLYLFVRLACEFFHFCKKTCSVALPAVSPCVIKGCGQKRSPRMCLSQGFCCICGSPLRSYGSANLRPSLQAVFCFLFLRVFIFHVVAASLRKGKPHLLLYS